MSYAFRGDQIKALRIVELNADGTTNLVDGHTLVLCCLESVNYDPDKRDKETVTIPSANADCEQRYVRNAKLYGYNVNIGVRFNLGELENILMGSRLNIDGSGNGNGEGTADYQCKSVSIEYVVSGVSGDCEEGQPAAWRLFPKVSSWDTVDTETYDSGKEVPTLTYTGTSELNTNYDDPFGIWTGSPSYFDPATEFTTKAITTNPIPTCDTLATGSDTLRYTYALTSTLV